jgi:Glycosyltransferase family 87
MGVRVFGRDDSDIQIRRFAHKLTGGGALIAFPRMALPLVPLAAIVLVFLPLTAAYDFHVFFSAGQAVLHGRGVYPPVGSGSVYSGSAFVYPFFVVAPFAALAVLPAGVSTLVFVGLSAAAVLVACLLATDRDPWRATLVLASAFTITGLQLGTISPLLFAGALFLWLLRDRPLAFAALAGLVVASKLFLLPLLVWPLLARRWRAFLLASLFTLALLAMGFLVGPLGPAGYARMLSQLSVHEARAGFALAGALENLGVGVTIAQASAIAVGAAVLGAAYLHHRRVHDERVLFCGGIVAALLVSPVVWSHYLILLAAPLLVLRVPSRWLCVAALVTWAVAPPHGQHLDTDLIDGIASSGTWLLVLAAALVVLASTPWARARGYGRRPSGGAASPVRTRLPPPQSLKAEPTLAYARPPSGPGVKR